MENHYGELAVTGTAMQEFEYDYAIYRFKFQAYAETIPQAVKDVSEKLERFLLLMEEDNVKTDMFRVSDNSTKETEHFISCSEDKEKERLPYTSIRSVRLVVPYTPAFSAFVMDMISSNNIDVIMDETYFFKNADKVKNQLIIAAMKDSKSKAELIASGIGKKVVGIKNVDADGLDRFKTQEHYSDIPGFQPPLAKSVTVKLSSPKIIETQAVNVIWFIN